jgi:hypothetical protein
LPDLASLLGLPVEFTFLEKTYKVHPRTLELEGMFSRWVSDQALQQILAHNLPPHILQAQMDGWRHDLAARLYDWTGWISIQAVNSEAGRKRLALLQLAKLNKGVTVDLVEQIAADSAKWAELLLKMKEASGEMDPTQPTAQPAVSEPAA